MFRPLKRQTRLGYYFTLLVLIGFGLVALAGVYKLLLLLPD